MKTPLPPEIGCNGILCRYSEIATKGRNRIAFENRLQESLRRSLRDIGKLHIIRERGRLFVCLPGCEPFGEDALGVVRRILPFVSGLSSASPGVLCEPSLADIERTVAGTFPAVYRGVADVTPESLPITYAMRVHRANKAFPMKSAELEIHFAEKLLAEYPRMSVDLTGARLLVEVEIRAERAFVAYERIQGPGGLPAGSGGRVLALLSGGIDSPVACYHMMRRGCLVDYITFHSDPYTPPELIAKVARLAGRLNRFQPRGRLVAVNLLPLQKAIRDTCDARYRTVLYRRGMVRIAAAAARCLGGKALVTGDNIGQVASQTLDNLAVVTAASPMLIMRPLLTMDKQDTVAVARHIGTLAESEKEVPDSCTVFAPANPATACKLARIEAQEARLDVLGLIHDCLDLTEQVDIDTLERSPLQKAHETADAILRKRHGDIL